MTTSRIDTGAVTLNVIDEGKGPPVVLLHGFPDTSRMWRHQIPVLVDAGFRVIAPDLRGRGDSDMPDGVEHYGLTHFTADVVGLLDALGIERAHIVGHDWGAVISWLLASLNPERVDHLVAFSVGRPGQHRRSIRELRKLWYMFMFQFPEAEEAMARHDWQYLRDWAASSPDIDAYIEDFSRPGALTAGINIYRANVHPATLLAEPFELPPIAAPTMGVWSTWDFALTEEQMTGSAASVTGPWRYERIENVTHWIPTEAPERTNELLLDFLPSPR